MACKPRQPKANTMLPLEQCDDFLRMPVALRELLLTELAAGNQVVEISHCHPAPPSGACFRLARRLITRAAESNDGLYYRERNSSLSSGEITDGQRFFFLVEPPLPLEPEPDMNAIWERANFGTNPSAPCSEPELESGEQTCSQRFKSSKVMNYEKWHDGVGYEVDLISQLSEEEQAEVQRMIVGKSKLEWFDIEALAKLNTPAARERLVEALSDPEFSVRNAVQQYAPKLVSETVKTKSLVEALRDASLYGGLSQALDEAEEFHPPEVIQALFDGARNRDGETAVLMAAMLLYVHGISDEAFDLNERPFFLRFNTEDPIERFKVFSELQQRLESHRR